MSSRMKVSVLVLLILGLSGVAWAQGDPSIVLADGGIGFADASVQMTAPLGGPAPVPKSGQATCYDGVGNLTRCDTGVGVGQDGHLQRGVAWPVPRFTINGDGTVTDNMTGLIWLQNADCPGGTVDWATGLDFANTLYDGSTGHAGGDCGLSDGSVAGDWRMPNRREMLSLLHYGQPTPGIPNTAGNAQWTAGDPFTNVQGHYWASTTNPQNKQFACGVFTVYAGPSGGNWKTSPLYLWPVRGPESGSSSGASIVLADGGIEFPDGSMQTTAAASGWVPVAATGQTTCYAVNGAVTPCAGTGQDGDHLAGLPLPTPRFTDNGDGTVTDNLTGLIWLEDAACGGTRIWTDALAFANTLASGQCGLTDGSIAGEWRLPNMPEMSSLANLEYGTPGHAPAISNTSGDGPWTSGDPFLSVQTTYWTSGNPPLDGNTDHAWIFWTPSASAEYRDKDTVYLYAWPVRGGS